MRGLGVMITIVGVRWSPEPTRAGGLMESSARLFRTRAYGVVLVTAVLLATGCGSTRDADAWSVVDSAGVRVVTSREPERTWHTSERPILSLGTIDDTGPTQFFRVRGVELLHGRRVAVVNAGSESIRIFDLRGQLLQEFGRPGRGPAEFTGLSLVGERGDSLVTYDSGNDRIGIRGADGSFKRSFRLEWFAGLLIPERLDGASILTTTVRSIADLEGTGEIVDSVLVSRYDYDGMLIDSIARVPGNVRVVVASGAYRTTVGEPYTVSASLVQRGNDVCYAFGPIAQIRCLGPDGRLTEIARLTRPTRRVTEQDITAFWEEVESRKPGAYREAQLRVRKNMVFPGAFPAFDRLRVDDAGRLWARLYVRPDREDPRTWFAFEAGRAVARIRTPPGFEIFDIEDGLVAGVARDEMEVEHVEVYTLDTGSP